MIQHVLLIPGEKPLIQTGPVTYGTVVATVGFPIEVINIDGGRAVMYVCEEGKSQGQPTNSAATQIANGALREGDRVVGVALLVGPLGAGGVDTTLPDEVMNDLLSRIEVMP